jgi:hypothetical protein
MLAIPRERVTAGMQAWSKSFDSLERLCMALHEGVAEWILE